MQSTSRRLPAKVRIALRRVIIGTGSIAFNILSGFDVLEFLHDAGWPSNLDELGDGIVAEADEQPLVTGRKITDGRVDREILGQSGSGHDFHAAPMPSRFDFVPTASMPIQLLRFPPSFRST